MSAAPGMTTTAAPATESSCRATVLHVSRGAGGRALHAGCMLRAALGTRRRCRRPMIHGGLVTGSRFVVDGRFLVRCRFLVHLRLLLMGRLIHCSVFVLRSGLIHRAGFVRLGRSVCSTRLVYHCRARLTHVFMRSCCMVKPGMMMVHMMRCFATGIMPGRAMMRHAYTPHMMRVVPMPAIPRRRSPARYHT